MSETVCELGTRQCALVPNLLLFKEYIKVHWPAPVPKGAYVHGEITAYFLILIGLSWGLVSSERKNGCPWAGAKQFVSLSAPASTCRGDLEQILMGRNQWLICASVSVSLLADVSHAATQETQDKENWTNNKAKPQKGQSGLGINQQRAHATHAILISPQYVSKITATPLKGHFLLEIVISLAPLGCWRASLACLAALG